MTKKTTRVCPRCNKKYGEYPALSRLDNKTDICSRCGTEEALFNWLWPDQELPPTNQRVRP